MVTLVTGASGFIGSHLAARLLDANDGEVRALVRPGPPRANLEPLVARGLVVSVGDLLDPASLAEALDGVTHLFHVAGLVSTRKREQRQIDDLNFKATMNLWSACRRSRVEKICYLGSIFALAGGSRTPLDEEAPYTLDAIPVPYFRAKRRAELATRAEQLPIVFAYPGYCLGPGDVYFSSMEIVDAFLRGQIPACLEGGMSFVDVRDAAAGLDLAMRRGALGRRYLLCSHNLTWDELFTRLSRITGKPAPRLRLPKALAAAMGRALEAVWANPPLDRARVEVMGNHFWYDSSRARTELGWEGRDLDPTLRDAVAWLRQLRHPLARPT